VRFRSAVLTLLALVLAIPAVAAAQPPANGAPVLVTGGGQIFADGSDPLGGPGDTVAFIGNEDRQQGSVQVVSTSETTEDGKPSVIYNGQVTCVEVDGDRAILTGVQRAGTEGPAQFYLEVNLAPGDDGEERNALIRFGEAEGDCDEDEETILEGRLARGTAKIDTARSGR
jgi:hypothetical protein